jgi:indole-3-glycerol phosphate synthase
MVADDGRAVEALVEEARACPPTRGFGPALAVGSGVAVIAEIKRRSPSKGALNIDLDPGGVARAYEVGGATCLSVLTDAEFFGGSPGDLAAAREATALPVLRKDFTVAPIDVVDARLMGADAVLLIAAVLGRLQLIDLHAVASDLGLDVLVEVHDEPELEIALQSGATLIGVNQRDLMTFEVDHERAARVASAIPDGIVKVAESGIRDREDTKRLTAAGYDAILVGERLVTSGDPGKAIRELLG